MQPTGAVTAAPVAANDSPEDQDAPDTRQAMRMEQGAVTEDAAFVARLRAGDQNAYRALVRRHHTGFVRLARVFCRVHATAEEVVQDAWIAVLTGIDGYSGEAPLKAWISGIVVNKARSRAVRDGRMRSFSDFARAGDDDATGLDPERFTANGAWAEPPAPWDGLTPEREAADRELLAHLSTEIEALPEAQRAVVLLRDVEGLEPAEICRMLDISDGNLRVLLHRARARLRAAIEARLVPTRGNGGG
jgi:RNA polymerase sigma-70 factor (ECF subfamily)